MIHRRLLQLAGAIPGAIALLALCSLLISCLQISFAFVLATLVAALIRGEGDLSRALMILTALLLAQAIAVWGRDVLAAKVGARVRIRLRRRLLTRLAGVPAADRDSGAIATTVLDGVDGLDPYYTKYLPQLMVVLIVPAAVVVLVWQQSPGAGLALAVAAAVAVLAPRVWDQRLLRHGRATWAQFANLSSRYVEALQQIPLLRAFGAGGRMAERLRRDADRLADATMAQLRVSLVDTWLTALAMHVGTVLAVFAAFVAVSTGSAPAATAMVVLVLARECFRPVQGLARHWHAGYLGLAAVDGLDSILSTPLQPVGDHDRPAVKGLVELADVSYRYRGSARGVSRLSLQIAPGETVAIIGASGSGKSTVAGLLERDVDPDHGAIKIDGTDLRDYTLPARTRSVVVAQQDPVLFAWTVRDNLRLHRPDAEATEIERAARAAEIHEVIEALPGGYDTVLAENGENLSGGQRQRLAIARALLSPAPVLILDEVTSALDLATERRVVDKLAIATAGRTMIVIAHRESACRHVDRWIALSDGHIADSGTGAPGADAFAGGGSR